MTFTNEQITEALSKVKYPGSEKDIVSLGMVDDIIIHGEEVSFALVLKKANDPFLSSIKKACIAAVSNYVSPKAKVEGNISVRQSADKIKTKPLNVEATNALSRVKNIIAVASGKGGVGKSTVSVNLSVSLAKQGYKVGLIDADIYGPSIPKMFQVEGKRPEVYRENGVDIIRPVEKYGVKMLSIGFFVNPEDALVWRGPMATSALKQLMTQGDWGALDFMVIDMPPGTSDIHLTLVQEVAVTGAIIVSTPQDVALADAIKGIGMFSEEKINVPILGLIENMSWFTPAELPENKYYIFGKDGCKKLAEELSIPLLGQIPIVQGIREGGDSGVPVAITPELPIYSAFMDLAAKVVSETERRNLERDPTHKVEITNTKGCSTN